jgi:hypothetical protein
VPDVQDRAPRLARGRTPCDHRGCDAEATRELRYGRIESKALPPTHYCDEHADEVQALFHVDYDLVLEAAVAAG